MSGTGDIELRGLEVGLLLLLVVVVAVLIWRGLGVVARDGGVRAVVAAAAAAGEEGGGGYDAIFPFSIDGPLPRP